MNYLHVMAYYGSANIRGSTQDETTDQQYAIVAIPSLTERNVERTHPRGETSWRVEPPG